MTSIAAVLFDMDGVIFEGDNFWLELHHAYGTEQQGVELAAQYLETDYATLAAHVAGELWRDKPAAPYERLAAERSYQPGVVELFSRLHDLQLKTAIVSSGPDLLARRAQQELGIDVVRANAIEVRDGRLTGGFDIRVPDSEKGRVGTEVMRELGVSPEQTAFVGDSAADVALAELVALPIAYNATDRDLTRVAAYSIGYGELVQLPDILAKTVA